MFSTRKPDNKIVDKKEPARPAERTDVAAPAMPTSFAPKSSAFVKGTSKMVPSVIGEDLTVTGNVISKGEVQVDGEIQGDVHCASLVVGEKATITGSVVAEDVIVRGRVLGSVRSQRVTLQSTSHVEGDIHHQSLAIEQGAYFEGKSRRSDNPMAAAKGEQAAAPKPAAPMGQPPMRDAQRAAPPPPRAAE
jgi:cytoskeletal protein CcmA (bactofilin family)